jgi:O-antigen/teichoic acid export membrane protein
VAAVYPVLARQFVDRPDRVVATYRRAFRFLVAFVLPAAAGLALVANDLIPALFGATFVPAATALAILVWGQALDSLNPLLTQTLRATDRERSAAAITGIGAAVNLALNVALIPPFGLYGAAVATVLSFAVLLAINLRVLHNAVGPAHLGDALTRSGAATAVMAAALWGLSRYALAGWSAGSRLAVLIAAGAVLYPLLAWVCGVLDAEDRALLGGLVRRRLGRAKGAA